jgi:preprotein translocase subunit YajC
MDPLTIGMFAILAVLIIFMFRNSRKRKQLVEDMRTKMVPGVEVMTNFGMFGTLRSIDEDTNVAEIETTPGTLVRVHRQTITKVVTQDDLDAPKSVEEAMERANREAELNEDHAIPVGEPKFGERVAEPVKKPVRRAARKSAE